MLPVIKKTVLIMVPKKVPSDLIPVYIAFPPLDLRRLERFRWWECGEACVSAAHGLRRDGATTGLYETETGKAEEMVQPPWLMRDQATVPDSPQAPIKSLSGLCISEIPLLTQSSWEVHNHGLMDILHKSECKYTNFNILPCSLIRECKRIG